MNTIERLEALAEKASERPWRSVRPCGSLVTDGTSLGHMEEANRAFYGGNLIAESVAPGDRDFIAAVVNALPDLLRVARAAEPLVDFDCAAVGDEVIAGPDGRCVACTIRGVLEPLFRETGLAVVEGQR